MTESFKSLKKKKQNKTDFYFQVTKEWSLVEFSMLPLAPSLFSFLIWKGADLALLLHNLTKEQVSQSNYLSVCMTRFRNRALSCQILIWKNFAESLW